MNKKVENKEGAALVVVLAFTLLAGILGASLMITSGSQARVSNAQVNLEKALFLAEAGVERAAQRIEDAKGYLGPTTELKQSLGDGTFEYTISRVGWRTYSLKSVGEANGVARQIDIPQVYLPTFAEYALWSHENGRIYFIGGEEFDGHVHANDKMWFSSQHGMGPHFKEECSSADDEYGGSLDHTIFDQGFELEAEEGQIAQVDFDELESLANQFGTVLEGETTITFLDNELEITNVRAGYDQERFPIQENDILYIKDAASGDDPLGTVHLEGGKLDGRLTIVSDDDININNHLKYKQNPLSGNSDDALGLISKDDVWVTQNAPDNLDIHAAILATGAKGPGHRGSFGVLDYWDSSVGTRGPLNIVGSIVQDKRGAVGTFNSNGPATGYYKNYAYDKRFAMESPPYYPVVDDKIEYVGWSDGPKTP